VALPAYQDYTVRARVTEVILSASTCRTSITEALSNAPASNAGNALASCAVTATKMVKSGTSTVDGLIYIVGDETGLKGDTSATANSIVLQPYVNDAGTVRKVVGTTDGGMLISEWRCGPAPTAASNPMPLKYLPGSCKGA
jgi:type IV pilus assembly protein PilA